VVRLYSPEQLGLPHAFTPTIESMPLVNYGGGSAVDAFAIQLAKKPNIHPIVAVAGKDISFVEFCIDRSKGDTIIDYRTGDEGVVQGLKNTLSGLTGLHAYDAISDKGSYINLATSLSRGGNIATVWPADKTLLPEGISVSQIMVVSVHQHEKNLGFVCSRMIARGLQQGWFKAHPYEVVPSRLNGLEKALFYLKIGKASAVKYALRIGETV
jgi:NADPH2:quinone reductase